MLNFYVLFYCKQINYLELLGLGNVLGLGLIQAQSLAAVPRLPLGLALQVGHAGLSCKLSGKEKSIKITVFVNQVYRNLYNWKRTGTRVDWIISQAQQRFVHP